MKKLRVRRRVARALARFILSYNAMLDAQARLREGR